MSRGRPSWLLAVVFVVSVAAVAGLEVLDLREASHDLVAVVVPILTALFVLDRVDARSDEHDAKLDAIEKATQGGDPPCPPSTP